jgi:hypothetical protein
MSWDQDPISQQPLYVTFPQASSRVETIKDNLAYLGLASVFLKTPCSMGVFVTEVSQPDLRGVCRFAVEYRTDGMLYHEPVLGKPQRRSLQERRVIPIQAGNPLASHLWDNHGVVAMVFQAT